MSVTKNINGSITLSDVVRNQLVAKTYYGYTLREARVDFRAIVAHYKKHGMPE